MAMASIKAASTPKEEGSVDRSNSKDASILTHNTKGSSEDDIEVVVDKVA
jgi:hypothetical protein